MKKVSLYLDDALWEALRIACLKAHITASKQAALLFLQFLHERECQEKSSAQAEER